MDEKLAELWGAPLSIREIREEMGYTSAQLRAAVRRLRLKTRRMSDEEELTEDQMRDWDAKIAARKLEVQAKWTPSEEWQRRVTKVSREFEVPGVQR